MRSGVLIWQICAATSILISHVTSHWSQHYRYQQKLLAKNSKWSKRQAFSGLGVQQPEIELNITVPYIFSARLYPYGVDKGDTLLDSAAFSQPHVLKTELVFFQEKFAIVYVTHDGAILFSPDYRSNLTNAGGSSRNFPKGVKVIAPFWTSTRRDDTGKVYFRESTDDNILTLASSEVQIQYRYVSNFKAKSVLIVTWENMAPPNEAADNEQRNTFQLALILSPSGSFAHIVYSRLKWHNNAFAGLSDGNANGGPFNLPGSGNGNVLRLANNSDIGIPGEWLIKIDGPNAHLCGPGFKGIECIHRCDPGEWYYDCVQTCHCANNGVCNIENGYCPGPIVTCAKGWTNPPACDTDVNECSDPNLSNRKVCGPEAPDCINTPGSFICSCSHSSSKANKCKASTALVVKEPQLQLVQTQQRQTNGQQRFPVTSAVPQKSQNNSSRNSLPGPLASATVRPNTTSTTLSAARQSPSNASFSKVDLPKIASAKAVSPKNHSFPSPTAFPATALADSTAEAATESDSSTTIACATQCGPNAVCVPDTDGIEHCVCEEGWTGDGIFCVDINECFATPNACKGNSQCQNAAGTFHCVCAEGLEYDAKREECVDINECELGIAECSNNSTQCANTYGSFDCRCKQGYNGNPLTIGCIDINECLIPEFYCGLNADCENTIGAYRCTCKAGFQLNSARTGCEDVNECLIEACSAEARCQNTIGSFFCECPGASEGLPTRPCSNTESVLYPFGTKLELPEAVQELPFQKETKIFGKLYSTLHISRYGIITLDEPLTDFKEGSIFKLPLLGFAVSYGRLDDQDAKSRSVYYRSELDPAVLESMSRDIQANFRVPAFAADSVTVITFEHSLGDGDGASDNEKARNVEQVAIISNLVETFAVFAFDIRSTLNAQAGILGPDDASTFEFPGSGLDLRLLSNSSNVNIKGKWMFKIDQSQLYTCPAGLTKPPFCLAKCIPGTWSFNCNKSCHCSDHVVCDPFIGSCPNNVCIEGFTGVDCHTDVDECAANSHRCSTNAICTNKHGGYFCRCKESFVGNGFQCSANSSSSWHTNAPAASSVGVKTGGTDDEEEEPIPSSTAKIDSCAAILCPENSHCIILSVGHTACACDQGFIGDSIECFPASVLQQLPASATSPVPALNKTPLPTLQEAPLDVGQKLNTARTRFQDLDNEASLPHQGVINSDDWLAARKSNANKDSHYQPDLQQLHNNPVDNREPQIKLQPEKSLAPPSQAGKTGENKRHSIAESASVSSNLLVIIIPAVLCSIWLILIAMLLVCCIRRRKKRQAEKYGLGYYVPSPTTIGSTAAYGTLRPIQNSPMPTAVYPTAWTIPRPTYELYSGGAYYVDPAYYATKHQ